MNPKPIEKRWNGVVIVAAPGPSLTPEVAEQCRGFPCIVVNDAWRLLPWADILYAADARWWRLHNGVREFKGERWIPHWAGASSSVISAIDEFKLRPVAGHGNDKFSLDPAKIHFGVKGTGQNGGLQAINIAFLSGGNPTVLVGFDMRKVDGQRHFFGDHPKPLMNAQNFGGWIVNIKNCAKVLPPEIRIINATPGSALKCFPMMTLEDALHGLEINHTT